jgi:hypothetical protein
MRAAVIRRSGATPAVDQFTDPQPGQGLSVGTLVAAALNPLDVAIVNGQFPLRRLQPPYIAGYEAVVQLGDGTRPRPRSPRPPSATSCSRSWVTARPPRPPRCAVPPTRN